MASFVQLILYCGFIQNDNDSRKRLSFYTWFDTSLTRLWKTASYFIFKFATGIKDDYKFYVAVHRWSLQNIRSSPYNEEYLQKTIQKWTSSFLLAPRNKICLINCILLLTFLIRQSQFSSHVNLLLTQVPRSLILSTNSIFSPSNCILVPN